MFISVLIYYAICNAHDMDKTYLCTVHTKQKQPGYKKDVRTIRGTGIFMIVIL